MKSSLGLFCLIALAISPSSLVSEQEPATGEFVRLDWPDGQLRQKPSACPIRVVLPIGRLFPRGGKLRSEKSRAVECGHARIDVLKVSAQKGYYDSRTKRTVETDEWVVEARAEILLRRGADRTVTITYSLQVDGEELATGTETLQADEGELNWGGGVSFQAPVAEIPAGAGVELAIEAAFGAG